MIDVSKYLPLQIDYDEASGDLSIVYEPYGIDYQAMGKTNELDALKTIKLILNEARYRYEKDLEAISDWVYWVEEDVKDYDSYKDLRKQCEDEDRERTR